MDFDELIEKTLTTSPRAGFTDRVMGAIASERVPSGIFAFLPRAAKRIVPIAAIAAAAAIVWAVTAVRDADDATAASIDSAELEW